SKQIEKEMQESKIYALSSRYEGFGMVIVEAMKMEIPVVSFNCPEGPGEIITHNNDGILVENGNIDEFAKQINRLI
ncbi:glycosyltransferase, partial [uncultured Clostridium sp.]